jgi:nucleotide-binding universal stress UspA family protein
VHTAEARSRAQASPALPRIASRRDRLRRWSSKRDNVWVRLLGIAEMSRPNCIVLATDLAPRTDRAQDRAVTLARGWRAKLAFVYAVAVAGVPSDDVKEPAAEIARRRAYRLLQAEASYTGDVTPKVVIEEGNAAAVVLKTAQMEGADLIVTGTAGISPLGQLLSGSTTAKLVAHALAPVLVVKKRGIPPYKRIIVASDLSDASATALETATALFQPSQITLYHAFDMPYRGLIDDKVAYEAGTRANALNETRAFASRYLGTSADGLNIEAGYGDAARCISEYAAQTEADVVLAGTHGRTGLFRVLLGSVALALIDDVPCDVMIVPSKGARSPV